MGDSVFQQAAQDRDLRKPLVKPDLLAPLDFIGQGRVDLVQAFPEGLVCEKLFFLLFQIDFRQHLVLENDLTDGFGQGGGFTAAAGA